MLYWLIPLIVGILLLVLFLMFRVKKQRVTAVIIKGCVSLMFIVTALVAWLTSNNPSSSFGIFVLIGLFFGLLGDVFLDIKFISEKHELLFTVLGFFAFAFCHLCYILGLFLNFFDFSRSVLFIIIPVIIALILTVGTSLMDKFTKIDYKKMKPYVAIYGAFLFFSVGIFFSASIQSNWQNVTLIIISFAYISFMASDLVLNNTYFAPGFNTPIYIIINHVLYYIAQFAIAISLFYLV